MIVKFPDIKKFPQMENLSQEERLFFYTQLVGHFRHSRRIQMNWGDGYGIITIFYLLSSLASFFFSYKIGLEASALISILGIGCIVSLIIVGSYDLYLTKKVASFAERGLEIEGKYYGLGSIFKELKEINIHAFRIEMIARAFPLSLVILIACISGTIFLTQVNILLGILGFCAYVTYFFLSIRSFIIRAKKVTLGYGLGSVKK